MLMVCQAWHRHDGWGTSWERICRLQSPRGFGEVHRGAQWWRQVLALRSPRCCGNPQSGSSRQESMQVMGAEGRWVGCPVEGG